MIINGKNTNKFKESSALGVEHYQNLISQPAKTTTKNTVSYEPVNISNFVKQIENEVSNKQTTTERIQSKMDKLWVDNTPNTSTVETSNTPQLRTTLAQQIKNGTAPSIQGKAKNNTLKQTANNVVKSVSEKVPVVNKYAQAYQTAKDTVEQQKINKANAYAQYKSVNISDFIKNVESGNLPKIEPKYQKITKNMDSTQIDRAEKINMANFGYKSKEEELYTHKKDIDNQIKEKEKYIQDYFTGKSLNINTKKYGSDVVNNIINTTKKEIESLKTKSDDLSTQIKDEQLDYEYGGVKYDDSFAGKFASNYSIGKLNEESNKAWSNYIDNPTQTNKSYAESIDAQIQEFSDKNSASLSGNGLISKSLANYLPQLLNQTGAGLKGAGTGAAASALAFASIPAIAGQLGPQVALPEEIVTVPAAAIFGATKGGKVGYVAGVGKYSYDNMRGAAFKGLLELGVNEETAIKAAKDEALVSSIIEMADTGVDIATLGVGKLVDLVGKNGVKAVAKGLAKEGAEDVAESAIKRVLKGLGKYGLNIAQEFGEEALQETVSIANENRFKDGSNTTGTLDLTGKSASKLFNLTDEEKARVLEAGVEGAKIATVMGGAEIAGSGIGNAFATRNIKSNSQISNINIQNSPTTQLQKPSNETISNQVKTAQNVNTGVTEQNSLKTVKTEPKTEEMSSKNELNKKLFDERMELFDELVKKGYAEYKIVNKSTEMFRTDKWNNEADQIYKKIEKLFNEEYYPSTVTDSAKQSQAIASLPTQNSIIIPQGEWENTTYQFEYKGKPITAEVRSYNPKTDSYFVKANIKGNVATGNFMEIPSTSFPFEVQQELNKYVKASNGILTTQAEQVSKLPTQKSVENVQEMGYNKYLRKTDKVAKYEYNQVQSEVMTWHSKEADGVHLIDLSKNGYKSYIYNKDGDSIEIIKRVDADEDTINTIRKEIENGTYNEPKALNQYLENVKNEIRRNRASSSQLPNRVRNDTNVGENNRNARTEERNNRTRIDENNSRNLKDSNKSSFSMSENSIKDNKGRILTKEQQEFFKDSKVRDENGNLLEVYHGTNVDFDVFDKKKTGTNFTYSKGGFFFTSKNSQAKSYGKYVKSCYLNMLNPLIIKSPSLVNPTDFYDTHDFMQEAITENNDGIIIKGTGEYQDETLYVAFKPEQIKFIDDLPTQESVENVQQGNKISQFKSSENGRPYMNLNKEISTNNESKNNRTGLSEIESVINEIVPVRHGKFRQKAYGIYKNRGEIIRIKQKNDIPVALHELTHHLDKQLGLSKTGKFDSELIPIAVVSDSANIDTKRAEGVAEFGRYYMTDPEYAKSIAPTYFEAFEENLKQSPQMYAKVEQLQNMVSDYLRQSPLNRTLSHIDFGDEETNLFKRVKDKYSEFKKTFRKNFVDDLDPLKQVINDITDNKKLPVDKDAYARLRLNRGVTGKVQVALEYGIVNNQGQKVGKSLKEIIEPVSKNMDEFVAYISALRAKDLQARNERVETGFNARDIDEIIKLYGENKEFNKASEELYKFQNQIMQKTLVSSGIITPEALEAYNKSNPHYVPFYRVMDENFNQTKDSMSKKPKKIKGSTRDIINPLESIVKNVYSYYMIADKNNAYKFLFSLANEYDGTGKWFDKVPTDMSGEKITAQDVKGILDKLDVNKEDIDYNELFTTLFKPSNYQKGNIITVMDKGKPVHYEIMDKDLYKILAPSSSKNENIFAKILSGGSSALRVGATHTLEFTLRNPIKDTFDAFTYSKNKFRPVVDTVIGIFNVAGKSDLYYKWLESGGSGSSYTNAQRATLKNTLEGITPNFENKSIPQKIGKSVKSAVTHPLKTYLNLIGELSNVTEEGTRVGEFRRALQNNKTLKQAALESRDITVDFSRGGEHIKEANKYIAFLNANVQGLDKMFTAFKERPVATTIKGLLAFVIPSMLIAALSGDDRDKVPQWEKDSHWIFFIGNTPVRIPKPQGIGGAFSNLGESIVDYMRTKNPEVFNHFVLEVLQSYNPTSDIASVLPNTFQPIVENTANYSFFKEQPIVKQSLENRSPKYQYDEYTSTVAKKIGSTLNVSPKKIDNLISGYFGNLGKDVATLLGLPFDAYENATSGKKKTYTTTNATLKKIPLVKGFIASDYANPKLDKFYENKSQALTDYTDVKFKYADKLDADTITDKVIDSSRLNGKEKKELKQAKNINSLYNSAYNKIKDKNDEIDKIEQGKGSNQFKKVQIDKVNKEINKILEQVEKDVETYKKRGTLPTKDD